jgi:ABC-type spermidine/putrescine transport system permease subunit II
MLPVAHAGHYVLWFLYLPPIVIVAFSLTRSKLNERRERRGSDRRGD